MSRGDALDTPRLIEGDLCTDGKGSWGYARTCSKDGRSWVAVKLLKGPRAGQWIPDYRATPVLDHEGGTLWNTCERCDRSFKATVRRVRVGELLTRDEPKEEKCRTCTGRRRTTAQRERDRHLDAAADHARRTKHHAVPGRDL